MESKPQYSEEWEQSRNRAAVEESDSERSEREGVQQSSLSQESRGSSPSIAEQYESERVCGEQSSISDQSSGSSTTYTTPPKTSTLGEHDSPSSMHSTRSSSGSSPHHSNQSKTTSPSPDNSPSSESFLDSCDEDFLANKYYRIIKKVGSGAYGSVYKAQNTQTNQTVAIKVLKSGKGYTSLETIDSVVKTTERLLEIRHINIVENYACDRIEVNASQSIHRLYIVREFTELPDLLNALQIENSLGNLIWWPLDEYQSRHLIRGIANGLNYLHENGMSHSDLKLDNVLLFWSNNATQQHRNTSMSDIFTRDKYLIYELMPKLTDFDKCKIRDDFDPEGMIMDTMTRSQVNYAAPESYRGVAYDLIKADCYSLGCCLMAMLLASFPFDEPLGIKDAFNTNDPDYAVKHQLYKDRCNGIKMDMRYVRQLIKHMSLPLRRVLQRLLDANSETRISIEQFLSEWFFQSLEESCKTERFSDFNRNYSQDV